GGLDYAAVASAVRTREEFRTSLAPEGVRRDPATEVTHRNRKGMPMSSATSEGPISEPNTMSGRIIGNRARPTRKMSAKTRFRAVRDLSMLREASNRNSPIPAHTAPKNRL